VVKLPAGQIFGLGLFGLLVFAGISLVLVTTAFSKISANMDSRKAAAQPEAPIQDVDFGSLVVKATGAAYSAFFDLSLSKVNFISNYVVPKEAGDRRWEYTFWELWVPNEFSFERARGKFQEKLKRLGRMVHIEAAELDAKTYRINIDVEGLSTHRVFLTRLGVETEKSAEAMFVLSDIDDKIPERKYSGPARVAIIIDDIGYRDLLEQQMLALEASITFSVLPFTPYGQNFARRARMKGKEIMLHMPMEAIDAANRPGRGGLFVRMTAAQIRQVTAQNLDWLPGISGVNNHMGSRFTTDAEKVAAALELIKSRGLYFIDSRTIGSSRAYEVARRMGIRSGVRNVFLDHNPEYGRVLGQFDVLAKVALRQGTAFAIGHPNDNTLRALRRKIPELMRRGIQIVPPSQIVR